MPSYTTQQIRNVALVGASGVGKTTLAEAMLHRAGVITRRGSIDDGSTALDRDPEEIARKSSISLGLASFDWKATDGRTYRINLLDTPGHPDFEADIAAALSVADLAVIVVSATDPIDVGSDMAWRRCAELGLPRFVFVTREGRPRANFQGVVDALTASYGSGFIPLELPLGEEEAFHGVADVITEQALEYEPDGSHHVEEMPADIAEREHEVHDQVVEEIVSGDDEQLERYLEGEELSVAELERTLAAEVLQCIEFPVLVGSGTLGIGVDRLADYICEIGPSPADRPVMVEGNEDLFEVGPNPSEAPLLSVFKTVADQYVGRISLFKVVTGTLKADAMLTDSVSGSQERLHGLFSLCGSTTTPVNSVVAGDLAGVAKLSNAVTGSTLRSDGQPVTVPRAPLPSAHLSVALVPRTQSDDDRLGEALQRLVQEDPSLVVTHDELSHQLVLRGVGDTHLSVALSRLAGRYDVHVDTADVRVPYRRTITTDAEAEGRVKKQSGGHGQFAVVNLRVKPLPRGGGVEFTDSIVGGAIPKQYVQATQYGAEDALSGGGQLGLPVVDISVDCYDGKTHSVDSSDMAFRTAASQGVLEAVEAAGPVVLEPIARLTISVPSDAQGEVLGDLASRRGRVVDSTIENGQQRIFADVPLAELRRYAMDLRAMSAGRGTYEMGDIEYDVLPDHLTADVLKSYQTS